MFLGKARKPKSYSGMEETMAGVISPQFGKPFPKNLETICRNTSQKYWHTPGITIKVTKFQIEIALQIFGLENQFSRFQKAETLVTWLDKKYLRPD